MLHAMRKRLQAMAEAEALGQSFWTEGFDQRVRSRIRHAYDHWAELGRFGLVPFTKARQLILEQEGGNAVFSVDLAPLEDFNWLLSSGDDAMYPTALEALMQAIFDSNLAYYAAHFRDAANEVFAQERVAWKFVAFKMVEIRSEELHEAVVEPALHLVHDARFAGVDATYRKALAELSKGDGADAVTDAGTALQELLTALGCAGNQLGDLIRSARQKGLLGAHDTPLLEAVERAMQWVAADRSQTGESHHASDATREDAWLIVHVVGAFIVRLAAGQQRPQR